jgi:hypothetical protein
MDGPVITVSAGETLWFEGRALRFQTAARVMLPQGCRFLRERDVVASETTDPPPELDAYLAVQDAHLATRAEYLRLVDVAQAKLAALGDAVEVTLARRALVMHRSHHALLALRPLVSHLDADDDEQPALCA